MTSSSYVLAGIDPRHADQLRAAGGIPYIADEQPGFPCRQCLRDAEIGDEMILVSYDPFDGFSPYRAASPIFLHRLACTVEPSVDALEYLTRRRLSVRGFDSFEMMVDAALIEGTDLPSTIERFFDDPAIDHLHVHNEPRGCWAARVERAAVVSVVPPQGLEP